MKGIQTLIIISLCMMTSIATAQTNDTILANQYYQQALEFFEKEDTSQQKFDLINQAYEIYEEQPFSRKKTEVMSLYAYSNYIQNDYTKSKVTANNVIENFQKQYNTDESPAIAYAYFTLQLVYLDSDYKLSAEYGEKAMKCFGANNDKYYRAAEQALRNYGFLQNNEKLKILLDQLDSDLASKPKSPNWIAVYRGKMQYNLLNYNFEEAIIWAKKLFEANEKHHIYTPHTLAPIYVELANIYSYSGQYDEAIKWINKGLESTDFTEEDAALGSFYANLAYTYDLKGDRDESIKYYNHAIELLLKDAEGMKYLISISYTNLAFAYYKKGAYEKAKQTIEVKSKYGRTVGDDMTLAESYYQLKEYEKATQTAHKLIITLSKNFNNTIITANPSKHETYQYINMAGRALKCKGKSLYEIGKASKDIETIKTSIETLELSKAIYHQKNAESQGFQQAKYVINQYELYSLDAIAQGYHAIYSINNDVNSFNNFFKTIEERKAIQLIETLTPSYLPEALYEEEKQLIKNVQLAGQNVDLATYQGQKDSIDYYQEQLFLANQELDNFIKKIKREYPKQTADVYETDYATIQDIQAVVAPQTLFISYSIVNDELMISAVGQNTENIYVMPLAEDLSDKIKRLNQLIQSDFAFQKKKREEFIDVSHELYQILITPIQSEIADKTTLMIVPEERLFNIPFEVLLATNDKKAYSELDFFIKKYNINYHYSATAFLKLQAKSTPMNNSFLGFAPVFKKGEELTEATRALDFMIDNLYRGIENNEFVALPNTKREINTIEKMLRSKGETTLLLQKNATKKGLESALKQEYQFVHIATHGIVNYKNPKLSALACYSANNEMDNLYYANEIQNSEITADLVVLSSCESGIGQLVASEGLIALNRSFLYSGAKNVLFSLWKVDDKQSSELMINFYKNYLDGKSYTESLRAAKLDLLNDEITAQPKYWAAFVLMGE